jgi:PIF1-like helicase
VPLPYGELFDPDTNVIGRKESKRRQEMLAMNNIMTQTGWSEAIPNSGLATVHLNLTVPDKIQNGSQWKVDVQKKRQALLDLCVEHLSGDTKLSPNFTLGEPNQVKIVDKSYLERVSNKRSDDDLVFVNSIVHDFDLNVEQERAFCIIANHSCNSQSEQLKMYIGGMGGTGKTQVLKALVQFFKVRHQLYRFAIVAPTGSAAALLAGSTYHSFFGFDDRSDDLVSNVKLSQVKSRLHGIDYVFFDEVSMLSCRDLYRISARLARVLNEMEAPFGGLNMIFAGDFGQLPPVIGQEYASLYSRTVGTGVSHQDQEAAIGKALWHQITTVVILQQNMRQKVQSQRDGQLRQALTNMRYKACIPEDLVFLRSLVSSHTSGRASVKQKEFRDISIITALNIHKDEINRLGSLRFATESQQSLL